MHQRMHDGYRWGTIVAPDFRHNDGVSRVCGTGSEEQMQVLRLTTPNLHPSDEDLSLGAPELHPSDEDLSLGTPELHPSDEDLSLGTPELKSVWGPVRSG